MPSQVQICNMALASLGQRAIANIDNQGDQNARICKLFYDDARKAALRASSWKFATRIETLATFAPQIPAVPQSIPGWNYVYAYPGNALSILKVYSDSDETRSVNDTFGYSQRVENYSGLDPKHGLSEPFRVIQNPNANTDDLVILFDANPAWAEYIIDEKNTALYDSNFVQSFSYCLAEMMAQPLTGDAKIAEKMDAAYARSLAKATKVNSQQGFQKPFLTSSILNTR